MKFEEPSQTKGEMDFDMNFAEQQKRYIKLFAMLGGDLEELKKEYNTNPAFRMVVDLYDKLQEHCLDKGG